MKPLLNAFAQKLAFWVGMSTLLWAQGLAAHELNPTIADLFTENNKVRIELKLNAESFLAGFDLDVLSDTDESASGADYDALQALSGDEIEARFQSFAPNFVNGLILNVDGRRTALQLVDIQTPDESTPNVARLSFAQFEADLPANAQELTVGWSRGYGEMILRQQGVESGFTGFLNGGDASPLIQISGGTQQSGMATFLDYIPVGFDHILPKGLDHILFVLGLFFLSLRMGPLLWQVSAFTLAHTVTLALGALGWVVVPGSIVEPIIAASIVYVGVENVISKGLSPWRPVVVFLFGLLHGLGFASVLGDFGLPAGQFIPALIGFNIGVEIGQLAVIAIAFLAVGLWFGKKPWYRAYIANPASIAIALIGAYWVIERTLL